ncbi:STAS domain-containing protein [Modestobacter italicus]|uniref:STAS domain-containing protein n=1 Tax=Modestobacter italicus (strain DSM 44449 / CECT 9708 / BC 501) TaxID=2732864 RepID=UPI001C948161|nr:STAS domain-containing protein [Modestobacter italicus]
MTTATAGTRPSSTGAEVVLALDEALLADGPADARWLLHRALLGGARTIVVDLRCVRSLPGPALAALLCAHRSCRARGGGLVLRDPDRTTRDTLRRTGLWRVLEVQDARGGVAVASRTPEPGWSGRGDGDRP